MVEFDSLAEARLLDAHRFEMQGSLEMAYLARWNVVEVAVKQHVYRSTCMSLRAKLNEWITFLDDPAKRTPPPIRTFPTDPTRTKLPISSELDKEFASALHLLELLDPTKKYRIKRNAIAHSAESFGRRTTYDEYKRKVEAATAELRESLSRITSPEVAR